MHWSDDGIDLLVDILALVRWIRCERRAADRARLVGVMSVVGLGVLDALDASGERMAGIGEGEIAKNVIE